MRTGSRPRTASMGVTVAVCVTINAGIYTRKVSYLVLGFREVQRHCQIEKGTQGRWKELYIYIYI